MSQVNLRTSIDCCQRFLTSANGFQGRSLADFNLQVGDWIRVYESKNFQVNMKVAERYWEIQDNHPVLVCYLTSPNGLTIPEFEKVLHNHGFHRIG